MGGKQLTVGTSRWGIPDADAEDVAKKVQVSMTDGTIVELGLLNAAGQLVKVLFNGRLAVTAEIDNGGVPRPSEYSS